MSRRIFHKLSRIERAALVGFATMLVVAGGLLLSQLFSQQTIRFAGHGTTYTEGLVASSLADVDPTVQALTHSALLSADDRGNPTGQLAESWHVSDDAKIFEFTLRPEVNRQIVLDALNPAAPDSLLTGTKVEPFGDRGIRITLTKSLAPFIAALSQPVVPVGPYIVSDRTKDHVTLVSRPDYLFGQPKLSTIVLAIFPTSAQLQQAINSRSVDGVADASADLKLPSYFTRYQLSLPRTTAAFFNLNREVAKDLAIRQQLINRKRFDEPLTLSVVTSETLAATPDVQQLLADWRAANVQVDLVTLPAAQLKRQRIPNRDYDVLIDGIDSGPDPDPYPFWHSSQRKGDGLNLSNFANIDADKLLEAARTTGNADERAKKLSEFSHLLDLQQPWLVLNHAPITFAVDRALVGPSAHAGFTPTDRYANVQSWHWR